MRLFRHMRARGRAPEDAATGSANGRGAWYPDPFEVADLRWWDGQGWTQQTRAANEPNEALAPAGVRQDRMPAAPVGGYRRWDAERQTRGPGPSVLGPERWLKLNDAGAEPAMQEPPANVAHARERWCPPDPPTVASDRPLPRSKTAPAKSESARWLPRDPTASSL
jgi:Protein of unknown function (DUF2510)